VRPVDTPWGRRTEIHQESCTLDGTCLDAACPALLTVIAEPGHRRAPVRAVDPTRLVEPPSRRVPRDFSVRVTGVGGTGVVTVAQVLAWAAHLEGRAVRTMDQTGIAQKGGAVVSDLRVSDEAVTAPHRLGAGECDLYLGGELLVAADPKNLLAADPHRTLAVVSTSRVPTGRQVADPTIAYPDLDEIRARVDAVTRRDESRWLDAADLSRRLLGSDTFANVVLLGVAYQIGALALRATSIERALEVNGVAVNENVTAFRLGRLVVTDPGAPELTDDAGPAHGATSATDARALGEIVALVGAPVGSELEGLVSARVADLARYQDLAYARRYAGVVARVRRGEVRVRDDDDPLARTVAIQLHRLMAYKDEYEVAALLTDPAQRARLRDDYGSRVRVAYHLRPPLVRRLGRSRPLTIGSWSDSTLRALVHLRRLRGTALDPFGHDHVRQLERRVRDDYATQMIRLADELTAETYERALALAELADLLRGFDDVKTARHATYDRRRRELLASP
jgi:indolepyruvate ferredoxin oxidoreductase